MIRGWLFILFYVLNLEQIEIGFSFFFDALLVKEIRCFTTAINYLQDFFFQRKKCIFISNYSSPFFLTNGITKTQFFASLMRHQRPNRCSCPIAAINLLPSFVNAKLFTKPVTATSNSSCSSRYVSLVFHILILPSQEPDATKSVLISVAIALIQFAWPFSSDRPWASVFTHSGFFFKALHRHNELFSMRNKYR